MVRSSVICWRGLGAGAPGHVFPGGCAGLFLVIARAPRKNYAPRHWCKLSWQGLRLRSARS
eukprot:9690602-Alexandrium_andersonii.AAC.1